MTQQEADEMLAAHQAGRRDAAAAFAAFKQRVMNDYPTSVDVQSSYIAGYIGELKRIAQQGK